MQQTYGDSSSSRSTAEDYRTSASAKLPSHERTPSSTFYIEYGKRLFDIVIVLLAIPFVLPIALGILAIIACENGKPIFSHKRVGFRGREFPCHKFRTMVPDSEARLQHLLATDQTAAAEWSKDFKLRNDPRVTRLGHFLRATSLDELPQLWNVLRGDMSLVGPRPVTKAELPLYRSNVDAYLSVRPGVTGRWQVSGRNSVQFEERVKLDRDYVAKQSFTEDLKILFMTVPTVLRKTGC